MLENKVNAMANEHGRGIGKKAITYAVGGIAIATALIYSLGGGTLAEACGPNHGNPPHTDNKGHHYGWDKGHHYGWERGKAWWKQGEEPPPAPFSESTSYEVGDSIYTIVDDAYQR